MLPILDASNIFFTTNYWFAKQLLSFNLVEFKQLKIKKIYFIMLKK